MKHADTGNFAERAVDAWSPPSSFKAAVRATFRHVALSLASTVYPRQSDFVRCLYAHTIFPEQGSAFRNMLRTLKGMGDFISTATLIDMVRSGSQPKGRFFHLSFDDGFANVFEIGAEVLAREKVPATIFVVPSFVEADHGPLSVYFSRLAAYRKPIRIMTWDQVRSAASEGLEIGSHTLTHARLSDISSDRSRLFQEIAKSKEVIEQNVGVPCRSFSWPYGTMHDIDDRGFSEIRRAGYDIAFSAVRGRVKTQTDIFQVPRHQIELHWPEAHVRLWARGFMEH